MTSPTIGSGDSTQQRSTQDPAQLAHIYKCYWLRHPHMQVNCVAWAPNSLYVASGGLDTSIILWSVEAPDKHCIIRFEEFWQIISCSYYWNTHNVNFKKSGTLTIKVKSPMLPGWTTPASFPLARYLSKWFRITSDR